MKPFLLAIDPGPKESAWVTYSPSDRRLLRSHLGNNMPGMGKDANDSVLYGVVGYAAQHPDLFRVVIEKVEHYGKDMPAGASLFETCRWSGRFEQMLLDRTGEGLVAEYIPRRQVKLALFGSARANDSDIRRAVIGILGEKGTKAQQGPTYGVSSDVWQAIGLALTASKTFA